MMKYELGNGAFNVMKVEDVEKLYQFLSTDSVDEEKGIHHVLVSIINARLAEANQSLETWDDNYTDELDELPIYTNLLHIVNRYLLVRHIVESAEQSE